jgi:hypothetical protein
MSEEQKDTIKRKKLTVALLEAKIKEKRGNVSSVAKAVGWSRSHVRRFIFAHKKLLEVMEDSRDEMKDAVESEFYRSCLDPNVQGHVTAMIFFLKTQCGWVERTEVQSDVSLRTTEPVKVTLYLPDNKRE